MGLLVRYIVYIIWSSNICTIYLSDYTVTLFEYKSGCMYVCKALLNATILNNYFLLRNHYRLWETRNYIKNITLIQIVGLIDRIRFWWSRNASLSLVMLHVTQNVNKPKPKKPAPPASQPACHKLILSKIDVYMYSTVQIRIYVCNYIFSFVN